MSLTAGTRIRPYEIKSPLGEGGMGVVFRALDTKQLVGGDFSIFGICGPLAVIAYESLSGAVPFRSNSIGDWRCNIRLATNRRADRSHFDDNRADNNGRILDELR